jgi:asparagine synthase (glutamine-hydrolysing)
MLDPGSGGVPNLGANDGALILPLSSSRFEDYQPTVQAAARAFLRTALPSGDWDELSIWLGLPAGAHNADASAYAAEHLRAPNSWTFLRASSFRSRLGHMDQLHLDLWWRGRNVAVDAGTYLYNAAPPWDNPLVTSRVHNCVTVDGQESMTRGGRFLVLDWFPADASRTLATDSAVLGSITGSHNGFKRLGISYQRRLSLVESGRWLVQDDLRFMRPQPHSVRLHWLLLDGEWRLSQRGPETSLRIKVPGGSIRILITVSGQAVSVPRMTLIRPGKLLEGEGNALPYEGWISPTYGRLVPALSLALEVQASHSFSFTTEFVLPG